MDWILWITPPFPIKHQRDKDDDDDYYDDDDDDDDDDCLEVWSNVRVGGNRFLYVVICTKMVLPISIHECFRHN